MFSNGDWVEVVEKNDEYFGWRGVIGGVSRDWTGPWFTVGFGDGRWSVYQREWLAPVEVPEAVMRWTRGGEL